MKKLLALALALLMVAALFAGCGSPKEEATEGNETEAEQTVLTMATNPEFPPFESIENGEIVGADIDMINAICDKLGMTLEITNVDFDAALTGAATGKYDIAVSGITATEERKKNMNFTDSYYKASQAVIIRSDSTIASVADLKGKTISCQEATTGEQYIMDNSEAEGYKLQSFKTGPEATAALVAGKVDAVVIDDAVAKALSEKQNGATKILDEPMTEEEYAIALKLGNDELTEKLNGAIKELKEDGTLKEIFAKYNLVIDE